jgi:hypothetical protein
MASKSTTDFIQEETFVISNGWEKNWANLNKAELAEIPWMKEAIDAHDSNLFIDDCLGFHIESITEAGAIHHRSGYHIRISKNTQKPSRFLLTEFYQNEEGRWISTHLREIRCATVSANFGTLSCGFRAFAHGPKVYYYKQDGTLVDYMCPHEKEWCYLCSTD